MSSLTYIPDGYTEPGHIKAGKNHGALRFKYRPLSPDDYNDLYDGRERTAKEHGARAREMLTRQLVEWDNKHDGAALPIADDVLKRMPPQLFNRLENVVAGFQPSDPEPGQPQPQAGLEKAEADLKN